MNIELVVMLTNHDLVVDGAIEIFKEAKNAPALCWGFKNVGQSEEYLRNLASIIKEAGKKLYFEVLEDEEEKAIYWAEFAVRNNFDYFLGLKYFESVHKILKEKGIAYIPFLGKGVEGKIYGTIDEIKEQAKEFQSKGVDGLNLSAFRYVGNQRDLLTYITQECEIPICVAGGVNSYEKIDCLKKAGVASFTIGGAFFDNVFGNGFQEQIQTISEYLDL